MEENSMIDIEKIMELQDGNGVSRLLDSNSKVIEHQAKRIKELEDGINEVMHRSMSSLEVRKRFLKDYKEGSKEDIKNNALIELLEVFINNLKKYTKI